MRIRRNLSFTVIIAMSLLMTACSWFSKPKPVLTPPLAPAPVVKQAAPDYYLCPDAQAVMANTTHSIWFNQGLAWSIDQTQWGIGTPLSFMQATIVNQNNSLNCFYRWPNPNPNQPGTSLWMSILLNPEADQVIKPYGQHWHSNDPHKTLSCQSALPQTCAFKLLNVGS